MKEKYFVKAVVAGALALGLVCEVSAQNMIPGKARVVRKSGNARFTTGNNVWQPVKVGDVYGSGTVIQTEQAKGSYVDLVLGDGNGAIGSSETPADRGFAPITASVASYQPRAEQNIVRIWENSALGIDGLSSMQTGGNTVTDTQLDLRAGHIFGTVKKMSAGSKYEIKLPSGVAGIRGTCYDLWANGLFRIGNGSGVISLMDKDNVLNTKVVPGGYEFDPGTGQLNSLPPSVINSLNKLEIDTRSVSAPQVTTFVADQTVHHVSHHHGHGDDNGQGNQP
jgi:hypothetical protein